MDSACGDGDFGTSMFVAFSRVRNALNTLQSDDVGILLSITGQAVLASAGGAAGPLFGTLFSEAGRVAKGKSEVNISDLAAMFESSQRKIESRGGADVGDKTLLDSLGPAVASFKNSSATKTELCEALKEAAQAAQTGYESTSNLVAKHGKARYLAEQAVGHPDPGARVIALMFEILETSNK